MGRPGDLLPANKVGGSLRLFDNHLLFADQLCSLGHAAREVLDVGGQRLHLNQIFRDGASIGGQVWRMTASGHEEAILGDRGYDRFEPRGDFVLIVAIGLESAADCGSSQAPPTRAAWREIVDVGEIRVRLFFCNVQPTDRTESDGVDAPLCGNRAEE